MKSKTSKSKKLEAIAKAGHDKHGSKNWGELKPGTAAHMLAITDAHNPVPAGGFGPLLHGPHVLSNPLMRIVVVVAENPQWGEATGQGFVQKSKKLETGRAMAQAVHAASKLKLSYVMWACQEQTEKAYEVAQKVMNQPITCICVKARDTNELQHIGYLAKERNLHMVEFHDENPTFYKTTVEPMTAIAIGPYTPEHFSGITDYLPLWKSPDEL